MSAVGLWLGVAVLGGAGSVARYLVDALVSERAGSWFPYGTLVVNLSGSLLLGLLVGAALHGDALVLAGTALMGSYTTFSTWMFESHRLGEGGRGRALVANIAVSLALGLAGIALGRAIGRAL
jgi:CrcB protein